MKFKSDIEIEAGLRDSSGNQGTSGQVLSSNGATVSWVAAGSSVASDVQNQVKAGVAINKGQAVYVTGADGTNIIVGKASNTSEATSSKTLGLLNATVAANEMADVVQIGRLAGLNTIGANAGDPVWLGQDGNLIYGLTNKPYAPLHLVFIGIVTRVNANNGEIFVTVQNGFELKEIHDVDLVTNVPVNGDVLGYNGTLWVNKTIAEWLGYTPVPTTRTITINGTTQDLSADQNWIVTSSGIAWLQSDATDLTVWNLGKGSIAGNTSFGYQAMKSNIDGGNNTVYGYNALLNNTTGGSNTVYGAYALSSATTGNENVSIGTGSLGAITTGALNTSIGWGAGSQLTDNSSGNVHIGYFAGPAYPIVESNKLYINNLGGIPLIGGDFVARTVEIDGKITSKGLLVNGQASTSYSSDSEVIGAKTLDFNSGNIAFFTLTGSTTITLSNAIAGAVYTIRLTQGGSGSNTAIWSPAVMWGGGITPTLSTTVGTIDIVTLLYDGTNFYGNIIKNFA